MKKLKILGLSILCGLLAIIVAVYVTDPLYLYHGPIFGMNEALFDSSLQVPGSIKNFDYDSVLIGSSMIENADVTILEEAYDSKMLKVSKQSGSMADLLFYLNQVHKYKDIHQIFMGMDVFAFAGGLEASVPSEYTPEYLFTDSMIDDYPYFFNKDILLKKLPMFLAYSLTGKYGHEKSYYFADGKTFDAAFAMQSYEQRDVEEKKDFSNEKALIDQNIDNLVMEIQSHPQITYHLFYSPYSLLWWDEIYRSGDYPKCFYILEQSLQALTALENVEVYFFMQEKDIVCNLDLYMDTQHFRPDINRYILESLNKDDSHLVQKDDVEEILKQTRELFDYIIQEGIYQYYTK